MGRPTGDGLKGYYRGKIEELELAIREKANNLRRLEAQRNELNSHVRLLREELQLLQEPGSYVGEVVKVMGKNKVLVKVHPEGKYVVEVDKSIEVASLATGARVALRNDSYALHLVLPTKVDPLVSLMKVRPVPFRLLVFSFLSFLVWSSRHPLRAAAGRPLRCSLLRRRLPPSLLSHGFSSPPTPSQTHPNPNRPNKTHKTTHKHTNRWRRCRTARTT